MEGHRVKLTEVNPHLVCVLCHGYFVDATTIAECLHSFCRSCIFRHLEVKAFCPICEVQVHSTKLHRSLKPDKTLQDIVYKLVPGLFHDEMKRRREFYSKYPYRDLHLEPERRGVGRDRLIYSPDDLISLSLEFYDSEREKEEWSNNNNGSPKPVSQETSSGPKRYLQCPAVFKMVHLKKFLKQKYGLPVSCSVEILYRRESLPDSYSLMDVAYIYTWKRNGPMRFYYRLPDVPMPVEYLEEKRVISGKEVEENKKEDADKDPVKEDAPAKEEPLKVQETATSQVVSKTEKIEGPPKPIHEKEASKHEPEEPETPKSSKSCDEIKPKDGKENEEPNLNQAKEPETPKVIHEQPPAPSLPVTSTSSTPTRTLSQNDELSVSVLLSLGKCRVAGETAEAKPLNGVKVDSGAKKPLMKSNARMSVNKIASDLAENGRLHQKLHQLNEKEKDSSSVFKTPLPPNSPVSKSKQASSPVNHPPMNTYSKVSMRTPNQSPNRNPSPPINQMPLPPTPPSATPCTTAPASTIPLTNGDSKSISPNSLDTSTTLVTVQSRPKTTATTNAASSNPAESRREITLNTSIGSLTISAQKTNGVPSKQPPPPPTAKPVNGQPNQNSLVVPQANVNSRLPTFNRPGMQPRKIAPHPGSKSNGPTLDQRIQQLYNNQNAKSQNGGASPSVKTPTSAAGRPESRLANWLNSRFPPVSQAAKPLSVAEKVPKPAKYINTNRPSEPPKYPSPPIVGAEHKTEEKPPSLKPNEQTSIEDSNLKNIMKVGKDMDALKKKLDELRKNKDSMWEITQENPNPVDDKKRRDVTPDVSIELLRASDMAKHQDTNGKAKAVKRPMPGLKALNSSPEGPKKPGSPEATSEEPKSKKMKITTVRKEVPAKSSTPPSKEQLNALDLSGGQHRGPVSELAHRMAMLHQAQHRFPRPQPPNQFHWLLNRPPILASHFLPRSP